MITREPTIERPAIAQALMLDPFDPFGLPEAAVSQAQARSASTLSTMPTCASRPPAMKAGAWRKASSIAAG